MPASSPVRIAIAQINTAVGDCKGNAEKIISYISKAKEQHADIVIFPEMAITGYPAEDLWLRKEFIENNLETLKEIILRTKGIGAVIGFACEEDGKLFNSAAYILDGKLEGTQHKTHLPNYGVFDEKRYFSPASHHQLFSCRGVDFAITICEDIWAEDDIIAEHSRQGASFIVNISASPFHKGKLQERIALLSKRAASQNVPIVYINLVGAQDQLVFDGASLIFDDAGKLIAKGNSFQEDFVVSPLQGSEIIPSIDDGEALLKALILGTRDFIRKNNFHDVVIGLSGGIDSSVTAAIAVEALGKEHVVGVLMPSVYTSEESEVDAAQLEKNLGIKVLHFPIDGIVNSYSQALAKEFEKVGIGRTEENIQARIRGNILMALSNKFGWLVLATGNKSEIATGYATLYGDLAGGLAVLGDVFKTDVYRLAEFINEKKDIIPKNVIAKAPAAELKPNQKDSDTLPPYEILDPILKSYLEDRKSEEEIIQMGYIPELVKGIIGMIHRNEFKRAQIPPCIKVSRMAFGKDWRMPISKHKG